jgi:probable F420-dependent oxidoreductase
MRIGFALPQMGRIAHHPQEAGRFAREAEELGAAGLWVGDRLLAPVKPTVGYAGTDSIPAAFHSVLDPFALLAVAAASTRTALIGSNVFVAPWYAPALLARSLTTLDLLSGGRLIVGLGTGWSPEEYAAAGIPMKERGARLDESLDALDALWTTNPAEYHGEHWTVPATYIDLKPAQRPRPPLYLAGFAPTAMRRVARRADGWLPVVIPGAGPFVPAAITAPMTEIRRLAVEEGRDPSEFDMVLRVYPTATASVEDVVDFIARAEREAGVTHAFVDLMNIAEDIDQALEITGRVLHRFA